jgi:hypothetical protein
VISCWPSALHNSLPHFKALNFHSVAFVIYGGWSTSESKVTATTENSTFVGCDDKMALFQSLVPPCQWLLALFIMATRLFASMKLPFTVLYPVELAMQAPAFNFLTLSVLFRNFGNRDP